MKKATKNYCTKLLIFTLLINSLGAWLLIPNISYKGVINNDPSIKIKDTILEQPKASSLPSTPKYSRARAYAYADKWTYGANPLYNDYSSGGGDCANFVSQVLIAGGLSLHKGTNGDGRGVYPDTNWPSSSSYGTIPFADYLDDHLRNYQNTSVTFVNEGSASIPDEITVGDVVIFGEDPGDNWEHAMVVVWDNGTFDIGLAGHSSQIWNRSFWTEIGYATFDCATFYHIEDEMTENYHFKVNTGALNVRVGPGLNDLGNNYQDIGDLHSGEEYIAIGIEKDEQGRDWWHFWFDERPAWCAAWYTLNTTGFTVVEVNVTSYLNVRSGPGAGYSDDGDTYDGMRYVSPTIDSGWYQYWYGGALKYSFGSLMIEISETEIVLSNSTFKKPVMGYLPYWVSNRDQNYSVVSHLAWFAIELNPDGTIGSKHGWPEWDVINAVHNAGNKIILTVTMFSDSEIHTLLTSYKTTAVNNLLAQVQAGNADGINIDFEMPSTSGDDVLLVEFMQLLYNTFKAARNDYHISIASPAVDWWGTWDYGALNNYVDAFMIMAYGYYWSGSSQAGPLSPLTRTGTDINDTINTYISQGVSKSKIILGLPFYGLDFPVTSSVKHANRDTARGNANSPSYSSIMTTISTYSPTINYDTNYESAWFNYNSGGLRQVWFDNLTSLERKFDFINARDLGGLGIWAYGYQYAYSELEQLIYDKFITNETIYYPPGAFTALTDADSPDMDGNFYINWSLSAGADNYSIYWSNIPIGNPEGGLLYASGITTNSSLVSNMVSGIYYLAVVAYNETGMILSNNLMVNVTLPFSLTSSAGTPDKDGEFVIYWDKVSSADNYTIYSFNYPITEINGTLTEEAKDLMITSHEITGVSNNTIIYYIVVARNITLNISSNYLEVNVMYGPPGEFFANSTADEIDTDGNFYISWDIPDGGTIYSIYRSDQYIYSYSNDLIEVVIDTITSSQYISGLDNGVHYIIVIAYNNYGSSTSNCITVVVRKPMTPEEGLLFIIVLVSILSGITILLSLAFRKRFHKSTLREREKLEKISSKAKKFRS
jgi:spore germination protein YaaH